MTSSACIIFDIDGTLVDSQTFDDHLFRKIVLEVINDAVLRANWSDYPDVTDSALVREICRATGLDATEYEPRVRSVFGNRVAAHITSGHPCRPTPGALALWNRIRAVCPGRIGIATSGWGHTARMKLVAAGIDHDEIPFACADDHPRRVDTPQACRAQIPAAGTTVYVGDGEWDQHAATALGWRFVGIGDRLRGKCPSWIPDFTAPDTFERIIG